MPCHPIASHLLRFSRCPVPLSGRRIALSDFYKTVEPRLIQYLEQSLDLFAKLCVGGNMRTRDVVSQFMSREILVAVLGLHTKVFKHQGGCAVVSF